MGSYITLGIGELELDWGKNFGFRDYSKLFTQADRKSINYYYADDEVIIKPGYSSPLSKVKRRLELIGYSLENLTHRFKEYNSEYPDYLDKPNISFLDLCKIFSDINIKNYKNKKEDGDYDLGEYVIENIFENENFKEFRKHIDIKDKDIASYFENFDSLFILRLLIENPENSDMELEWRTQDLIDGGWTNDDEIYVGVQEEDKFLIVTEGSSDTFIIRKTLELLYPDILDFFSFVDMEDNYPFTGTGNLYRFCQGLTSIRIQNKTLIIFDNDLEGIEKYEKTIELDIPKNMNVMKLPNLDKFNNFLSVGPSGEFNDNINGKAIAIECFLDLSSEKTPRIRWSNFNEKMQKYQGSIEKKDKYVREFKKVRTTNDKYDFSKLEILIEEIYKNCVEHRV
ncbi:HEPN/Toprim-associated domain-containing protein [Olleya namhaensis]|uniref:HEPN/Toprim-associated domain-containing protein n=1 Tax=Olleya namhaensis TaxID=1144750 RepID=UPI00232EDCCE|nr:HEPN/Toprim-associated domain-containing protein [Olleya namhaensis]